MSSVLKATMFLLCFSAFGFAQDPLPVVSSGWQRTVRHAPIPGTSALPARSITADDKYFQRQAREERTDKPMSPEQDSIDARSAALEKASQESRTPKADDTTGYTYTANVRNDSGKTVVVVFWEYSFGEVARPQNIVRRQFLCSVKLKNGQSKELSAFSQLGPSDVIDAKSLANPDGKLFNENVTVNRIEFADGSILQRGDWKFDDVKKDVERAVATPWGNEVCRRL